ncbi:unnamed protein product [Anisakis simplex]|uniref:Protein scabrous (inferred by orthology to a D. melanogaster protein) n=1 Tax=Anisakis simplex TaxID=6269 RepID=A0A0M3KA21_ANISI|nr:unnamed protein product [Anisakis simplex]
MMNSSNIGKEITSRQNEKNMTERMLQLELKNKQEKQARHQEQKLQNDKLLRIEDGLNRTRSLTEKWMLVSDAMKLSHIRLFSSLTDQMSILNSLETKFNKAALKLSNLQVEVMNITHNGLLSTAACNVTEMAIRSKIDLEKMQKNERYKVDSLILEVGKKADESTVRQLQLILASTNDKLEKFDSNLRNVIKKLNDSQSSLNNLEASLPKACSDSMTTYGVHKEYLLIKPSDKLPSQMVHCDKDWTIIQQRMDGAVRFNRTFEEYRWPFGNVDADHWIGNEYINALTQLCDCSIRFETWDVFGEYRLAIYHNFSVSDFDHLYRLSISNYDSNSSNLTDAMSFHDGRRFSSLDRDEDTSSTHCARYYAAGR